MKSCTIRIINGVETLSAKLKFFFRLIEKYTPQSLSIKGRSIVMMGIIGRHLTIDMYGCSFDNLNNLEFIKEAMFTAISESDMTLLNFTYHKFEPQGLTALALLAESHMSVHTYPEKGYAAIDVFTCGDTSRPDHAAKVLRRFLKPEKIKITNIKRGDFGSISDMKPKIKVTVTPIRRVRDTGAKVFKFLSRK
jgi:S-adenosylmethionine decarboxylase